MLRGSRSLLPLVLAILTVPVCYAQSAPQHVRDYIYGPGGRLITTAEPDPYPPTIPSTIWASPGACASDGITVGWGTSTDIGSGFGHFNLYRADIGLIGSYTSYQMTDTNIYPNITYTYSVTAVDNAGNESDSTSTSASVPTCFCKSFLPLMCPRDRKHDPAANAALFPEPVDQLSGFRRALRAVHLITLRPVATPVTAATSVQPRVADTPRASPPVRAAESKPDKPSKPGTAPPHDVKNTTGGGR